MEFILQVVQAELIAAISGKEEGNINMTIFPCIHINIKISQGFMCNGRQGTCAALERWDINVISLFLQLGLVFGSKLERAVDEECESGSYTRSGECCLQCPPGEGVVKECGDTQTECSQCLDSEYTFSYTHTC